MSLATFLAARFYRSTGSSRQRRASKLATRIATAGVALGLAVMLCSVAVVKGFQGEIRAKLASAAAPLEVLDTRSVVSPESFPVRADSSRLAALRALEGVERVQRSASKMGIIKTEDAFQTIWLKGIGADYDTARIAACMVEGRLPRRDDGGRDETIVSRTLARQLGIEVGERVFAYFVADNIRVRRLAVVGVYETNLAQIDEHYVWTRLSTVARLNGWADDECHAIEVQPRQGADVGALQQRINSIVGADGGEYVTALSMAENPTTAPVVQWLTLLDTNVWIILALMMGVAGFTTISGLLILILERTRTIALLGAMGATGGRVRHVFLTYAVFIVLRGMFWGNVVGLGLVAAQHFFGFVRLDPATYYVDAVPVELSLLWIVGLNVATLVASTLAMIVPSFLASRIEPARAIRFD